MKKIITILLIIPLLVSCNEKDTKNEIKIKDNAPVNKEVLEPMQLWWWSWEPTTIKVERP